MSTAGSIQDQSRPTKESQLRRIIITGTAVAVLVGAGAAFAAGFFNTYTGTSFKFNGKAGSPAKPAPLGFVQSLKASPAGTNGNDRAAPLVDIKTTIYGMISNAKSFPACSDAKIVSNHLKWDKSCPAGSLVATGPVTAKLGDTTLKGVGSPCTPFLKVYNGGKGKLIFFFNVAPQAPGHVCANLQTGASAPYDGTVKQQGKNLVTDVPLPPDVSTQAGGLTGVYGSLILENLTWKKLSKKVNGKTIGFQASTGCKSGKRPWSVKYTAVTPTGRESRTVTGSNKC
jgi:hypothetical protein